MNFFKNQWWDYLFLLVLLLGSLWQVSFLQATMKWDIMDITLPWNYFISECINNGELPLWNPFINSGFAQMGINDTWNPITWILGLVFGYDPIVIQFQYLGHLFLGGVGFYHSGKYLGWIRTVCLVSASAYMLSGFMIGNAQHLGWTVGASWIPWIFLSYKKWEDQPNISQGFRLGVLVALMFLSSYPGIFIALVYLLLCLFLYRIFSLWKNGSITSLKKTLSASFIPGGTFLLLTAVAWIGIWRLSDMINRGDSLPLEAVLGGSLPWEAIVTFLFPAASASEEFIWGESFTLVNCYIGLIPFAFLSLKCFHSFKFWKHPFFKYLLLGIFFFLLAMGKDFPMRSLFYYIIPLMDIFRLPSYFRILGIFFFLIASGISINYFFNQKNQQYIYKYLIGLGVAILGIALWAKSKVDIDGGMMVERNGEWELLPVAQFWSNIGSQGLLHFMLLIILSIGLIFIKKRSWRNALLLIVTAVDLFFAVQFNVAATVTHEISPKMVNDAFHQYTPKGFPTPPIDRPFQQLHQVANFDFIHLHLNLNHFHKVPTPDGASPLHFKWGDQSQPLYQKTIQNPLVFAAAEISAEGIIVENSIDTLSFQKINIKHFSPNNIEMEVNFSKPVHLVYLQNYHPDWQTFVDGKKGSPRLCNQSFLATSIPRGKHTVRFSFQPKVERWAYWISLASWILVGMFFITKKIRRRTNR